MQTLRHACNRFAGLALLVLAPIGLSAANFEGTISLRMSEGRQTHDVTYATKGGQMRIGMDAGPMGQVAAIVSLAERQIFMLMPAQKMYLVMPFANQMDAAMEKAGAARDHLQKTAETQTILGYPCTKYVYQDEQGPVEIWGTDRLGQFVALPSGNPMQRGAQKPGWETAIAGDFFPMRLIATSTGGQERMRWEVTAVKAETLDAALFTLPAGYQKLDMGGMMSGLGGLMPGS